MQGLIEQRSRLITQSEMTGNIDSGVIVKLFVFVLISLWITNTESKTSIACNVDSTLKCAQHSLTCSSTASISITGGHYSYQLSCRKTTNCSTTATSSTDCCSTGPVDCTVPLGSNRLSRISSSCSGTRTSCTFALGDNEIRCKNVTSNPSFSVIEYNCVPTTTALPAPTTTPTTSKKTTIRTTTTTVSSTSQLAISSSLATVKPIGCQESGVAARAAVVQGVLGMFICILIILLVLEFLYFYRKLRILRKQATDGQVISHYSSTHRATPTEEDKPSYDVLQRNQSVETESEKQTYDIVCTPQPKDDARLYYNLDSVRTKSNPIYCNLNNRADSITR